MTIREAAADFMSAEEFLDLVGVAEQDRPLYLFTGWTGLRVTELLHLEWSDIPDGFVIVLPRRRPWKPIVPNS